MFPAVSKGSGLWVADWDDDEAVPSFEGPDRDRLEVEAPSEGFARLRLNSLYGL